jgi:O-antigen ligase
LEIWLEQGILALFVFLFTITYLFVKSLMKLKNLKNSANYLIGLVLSLSLLAYCIQWLTFSPIYIMPIFILLGLGFNWLENDSERVVS